MTAGKRNVWCGGGGGAAFLHCLLSLSKFFLSTSNLVDCVARGHTVSWKVRPLPVVNVAGSEQLLQAVLESLLRSPFLTMASGKFADHDNLWEAMVFLSGNMTSPSELVLQDHGFDAGNLSLL